MHDSTLGGIRSASQEAAHRRSKARLGDTKPCRRIHFSMVRKLKSGEFRLYSRKKDPSTGKRRNLGTFPSLEKAKKHEREIQYFKKH